MVSKCQRRKLPYLRPGVSLTQKATSLGSPLQAGDGELHAPGPCHTGRAPGAAALLLQIPGSEQAVVVLGGRREITR